MTSPEYKHIIILRDKWHIVQSLRKACAEAGHKVTFGHSDFGMNHTWLLEQAREYNGEYGLIYIIKESDTLVGRMVEAIGFDNDEDHVAFILRWS